MCRGCGLRSAPTAIVHAGSGYCLPPDSTVDAVEARRALAAAEAAALADPASAVDLAAEALALWSGPSLGEFAHLGWFVPVAVGLDAARDRLRATMASAMVSCGRTAEAIELLATMVAERPLDESAQRLLVRALAESGRTADALRAANAFRLQLREETGLDPSPALEELELAVLTGEIAADRATRSVSVARRDRPASGLPRPSRLVGRSSELAALRTTLRHRRLVTVLGTGGVGKSRLVAELIAEMDARDRVVVELASAQPSEVADAVARALGFRAGRAEVRSIIEVVGSGDVLVVLDNCEHVVEAVRELVRAALTGCPGVRFLVTTRSKLALADEHLLPLPPLETRGDRPAAMELFADRLANAHPGSDIDVWSVEVRRLCEQLDGLPLALELAAGRVAVLGVEAMSTRLASSNELLAAPVEAGAGRHASVESVVSCSYQLLGPAPQRLLAAVAVFEGEFDLAAVEVIASAVIEAAPGPLFVRLIDTCLVALGGETGWFRLLDVVRRFAERHLVASGREAAVRRAHGRWVAAELAAIRAGVAGAMARLARLRGDARRGVAAAVQAGDVDGVAAIADGLAGALLYRPDADLATCIVAAATLPAVVGAPTEATLAAAGSRMAWLLGDLATAEQLARRTLDIAAPGDTGGDARARAHHSLGVLALYAGDFDTAAAEFGAAVAEPTGTRADRFDALGGAALAHAYAGRLDQAARCAAGQRAIANATGNRTFLAFTDYVDGERALAGGDQADAIEALRRAAEGAWSSGASFVWGLASTVLAATLVRGGSYGAATDALPDLLRRWRQTATWPQLWTSLRLTALVLAHRGDLATAATILAAADTDHSAPDTADVAAIDRLWAVLSASEGDRAAGDARAAVLERHEVLDLAISALTAESTPDAAPRKRAVVTPHDGAFNRTSRRHPPMNVATPGRARGSPPPSAQRAPRARRFQVPRASARVVGRSRCERRRRDAARPVVRDADAEPDVLLLGRPARLGHEAVCA